VLGLVIGALFERYLFISTQLYGIDWLFRPAVLAVMAAVAWVLYRPASALVAQMTEVFKSKGPREISFGAPARFTALVLVVMFAAIVSAFDWPRNARLVPLTVAVIGTVAATLNLITEVLVGKLAAGAAAGGHVRASIPTIFDLPSSLVHARAVGYFGWLLLFLALIGLLGFVPAIAVFIACYMRFGFKERWPMALVCAAATAMFCWVVFSLLLDVTWPTPLLGDAWNHVRLWI
jgi:hypothetical protein